TAAASFHCANALAGSLAGGADATLLRLAVAMGLTDVVGFAAMVVVVTGKESGAALPERPGTDGCVGRGDERCSRQGNCRYQHRHSSTDENDVNKRVGSTSCSSQRA